MNLDEELESMEELGETEAEWIDQETEIQDVEDDQDEIFGEDAAESDLEHAFDSYMTTNEADYNGWDDSEVDRALQDEEDADILHSEGYHLEDSHELESEVIEMEVEDGDIYAVIVDENDNEIGFILLDENGEEQEYYYVDEDEEDETLEVVRAEDGEEFDLGITREGVAQATADINAIYRDGAEVLSELKGAYDDIAEGLSFFKKRR